MSRSKPLHRVVILGGGFGGLYAAKQLGGRPGIDVTVVDRRNFHLFQPLLYQVATGGLSPGDIASPIRAVLSRFANVRVLTGEASGLDVSNKRLVLKDGEVAYDTLVVAAGARFHYFGNEAWATHAPGLKTIEDALEIRRRVFTAFETAEREPDNDRRAAWMRFVIVGGGPTGVELAGAVAELCHGTLKADFRAIDTRQAEVVLLEGTDRILPPYPERLSRKAKGALERLGVSVLTNSLVTAIDQQGVSYRTGEEEVHLPARTKLWAVGVSASEFAQAVAAGTGASVDRGGRIVVGEDLTVPGHPEIFAIGDLASCAGASGEPLPGVAPVAMQQGRFVAKAIRARLAGRGVASFRYADKGSLAVIGRNAAVAYLGRFGISGFPAWLTWVFIHIAYLIEFDSKVLVIFQWGWNYLTRKRGARLITGTETLRDVGVGEGTTKT
jgi:NADH dehydrogenase